MRRAGLRFTVAAPIAVAGASWGAVAVTSTTLAQPAPGSEARLGDFCELVSLAVASAQAREDVRASRVRLVRAADTERKRLERNLHDGAQQRLISLSIAVRLARSKLESDTTLVESLLDTAVRDVEEAIRELRELARGLHPVILTERGVRPALGALAARAPLPVELVEVPAERLPEPVEAAAYYIVSEALTNVAKHSGAAQATVSVRREGGLLAVEICDDGRGGARTSGGSGLLGLQDRVDALGGSLALTSGAGRGTVVRALLPLA
jgi:signal transduction histidine kinase